MSTIDPPNPIFSDGFQGPTPEQRDMVLHKCSECGQTVRVSGSAIRTAKQINAKVSLPCGHITSI